MCRQRILLDEKAKKKKKKNIITIVSTLPSSLRRHFLSTVIYLALPFARRHHYLCVAIRSALPSLPIRSHPQRQHDRTPSSSPCRNLLFAAIFSLPRSALRRDRFFPATVIALPSSPPS
jgi:hypothetical protein